MGWKAGKWKLNLKAGKDKWIVMLALGLIRSEERRVGKEC